jgi:hypothetical protein
MYRRWSGAVNFPEMLEPCQKPKRREGDMNQVPYRGPINLRHLMNNPVPRMFKSLG